MSAKDFGGYVTAQILGGLAGAGILALIINCTALGTVTEVGLGTNGYGQASYVGLDMTGALIVEVILTFVFVLTILGATAKAKTSTAAGLVKWGRSKV